MPISSRPINGVAFAIFHNQGQACIAGSRLLLHETSPTNSSTAFSRWHARSGSATRSTPPPKWARSLPPASRPRAQLLKVAHREGGEILIRRPAAADLAGLSQGCYVQPTVVRATAATASAVEEVFGPFVSVTTFRDEAKRSRSPTPPNTAWAAALDDESRSRPSRRPAPFSRHGLDQQLQACQSGLAISAASGSGYGREMGFEAMHDYTEAKSVWVNVDAELPSWYPR